MSWLAGVVGDAVDRWSRAWTAPDTLPPHSLTYGLVVADDGWTSPELQLARWPCRLGDLAPGRLGMITVHASFRAGREYHMTFRGSARRRVLPWWPAGPRLEAPWPAVRRAMTVAGKAATPDRVTCGPDDLTEAWLARAGPYMDFGTGHTRLDPRPWLDSLANPTLAIVVRYRNGDTVEYPAE